MKSNLLIGLQTVSTAGLIGIVVSTGIVLFKETGIQNVDSYIQKILLSLVAPILSAVITYKSNNKSEIIITHNFNTDSDKIAMRRLANMV